MKTPGAENISELLTAMQVENSSTRGSERNEFGRNEMTNMPSENGKLSFDSEDDLSEDTSEECVGRSDAYSKMKLRTVKRRAVTSFNLNSATENSGLSASHDGDVKKYGINMMTTESERFGEVCRKIIGTGKCFCTKKDCTTNHKGKLFNVRPGSVYVVRESSRAGFCIPVLPPSLMSNDCLGSLMTENKTLSDWSVIFHRINDLYDPNHISKISKHDLDEAEIEEEEAMKYRSPSRKSKSSSHILFDDQSLYKQQKILSLHNLVKLDEEEKIRSILGYISILDLGADGIQSLLIQLIDELSESVEELSSSQAKLDKKLSVLNRQIGTKTDRLNAIMESPSLWEVVEDLLERMNSSSASNSTDEKEEFESQKLKARTSMLERQVQCLLSTASLPPTKSSHLTPDFEMWKDLVTAMGKKVLKLEQGEKSGSVHYGGVSFEGPGDAKAWVQTQIDLADVGYIVDPHTVLEHVYASLVGEDFLKTFEKLHKLQVETLSQGLMMSSYQQPIPKLFSSGKNKVIKEDSSFLDKIISWDDWGYPDTGMRAVLTTKLQEFIDSHQKIVDASLVLGSPAYTLATMSATESVAWVESLMTFVDNFMKNLTKARFSNKKALHVTSRLVKRIFEEVFRPRQGVIKAFKTRDQLQVTSSMLWSSLQSLQVALKLKNLGLKDLDVVSSELVKFLLVNTGYDSIERLQKQVETLTASVSSAQKSVKGALTSSITATNKVDELQKQITALEKRLSKAENKLG